MREHLSKTITSDITIPTIAQSIVISGTTFLVLSVSLKYVYYPLISFLHYICNRYKLSCSCTIDDVVDVICKYNC